MPKIKENELREKLERAAQKVCEEDDDLLALDAHEVSLCHRLAYYLEQDLPENGYHVDIEYNRHGELPKRLQSLEGRTFLCDLCGTEHVAHSGNGHLVRPDLVIHHRGNDEDNLLVVECKKSFGESWEQEFAIAKVKAFMDDDYEFRYTYGAFVVFNPHEDRHIVHWFSRS